MCFLLLALSRKDVPTEQRRAIFANISDALSESIATETDDDLLTALFTSWSTSLTSLRGCLSPASREIFIKAIKSQLSDIEERDRVRTSVDEYEDEDDEIWDEDPYVSDANVVAGVSQALKQLFKSEGAATPVQPLLRFLELAESRTIPIAEFGMRFIGDLVSNVGAGMAIFVKPHLKAVVENLKSERQFFFQFHQSRG